VPGFRNMTLADLAEAASPVKDADKKASKKK